MYNMPLIALLFLKKALPILMLRHSHQDDKVSSFNLIIDCYSSFRFKFIMLCIPLFAAFLQPSHNIMQNTDSVFISAKINAVSEEKNGSKREKSGGGVQGVGEGEGEDTWCQRRRRQIERWNRKSRRNCRRAVKSQAEMSYC